MVSYWIYKILHGVNEDALCHELYLRELRFVRQQSVPIPYKGIKLGTDLRLDLLIEDKVIVDLKAKDKLSPIDKPNLDKPEFPQRDALGTCFKLQIYNNPRLPKRNGGQVCDLCPAPQAVAVSF
ncbi:GxxExxY protein [bacterium]|nr:GxxExxY protein [bacterium]